ncbi:flagellar biosynthesis anti-sigma factor FlgM [Shewanella kaireitica]|uniref:flagellar biosynthesis anti-sigma factor FlgM n=1 Tax=Shewanella kaireitica TaxID=212021 RepID=UPI00200E4F6F|nr:flagellar biosynthesis anti-sigma factor FlgM [Shewanella kaireitica]MCL1096231.1 flagellar biosynthesis anti-sigma factor FlgM [Shewanella kaireitica]
MEINKINSAMSTEMGTSKSNRGTVQPLKPSSDVAKAAAAVSDDCKLIAHAKSRLEQLPDVDMNKVAEVRQSLIDGNFDLNLDKVVDAMVLQHG